MGHSISRTRKHVLCEKPIAANFSQASEMAQACRKHNLQLMDGVMWVHHQRTAVMKQIIEKGNLESSTRRFGFYLQLGSNSEDNIRTKRAGRRITWRPRLLLCARYLWAFEDLPERVFTYLFRTSGSTLM